MRFPAHEQAPLCRRAAAGQEDVEEAAELAIEAMRGDREAAVLEAADLVYNLVVLLDGMGIGFDDVCDELGRRRRPLRHRRASSRRTARRRAPPRRSRGGYSFG